MASDVLALSAEQLLKKRAIELFADESNARRLFRDLARRWHPDAGGRSDVFAHVSRLFAEAQRAWIDGSYPNTLKIIKNTGPVFYPYIAVKKFELGELYVGERHVIWATERRYDDLVKRGLATIKTYKFPNDRVRDQTLPFVPRNGHTVANGDRAYTIYDRPADYVRVADVLERLGPLDPRHVCWILSRSYQIAGFFEYAGINHLDFSAETFFIEPETHFGALLGGWFYSAPRGMTPLAAPARSAHFARSKAAIDAQIRSMGRKLLGVYSPGELRSRNDVNEHVRSWLLGTPLERPALAQRGWRETLTNAFGKRTFTEFKISTTDVYS